MISANTVTKPPDDAVVLRIIRPGAKHQGTTGDDRTPANFQRRRLRKLGDKMEPGLSVSISGVISDKEVLQSFAQDGNIAGLKLAECTVAELRDAGFVVALKPTIKNEAHAQLRCVACDFKDIDCFPSDCSDCKLDRLEFQRELADLFRPHTINNVTA
ncbi:hypothetical protein KBI23_13015 [bacterium]|nr:hypothetical protein [bacterium]MBP9810255.1 hypothetical protein [bacterium]